MSSSSQKEAWSLDQLAKSEFFHQKLHEWQLLEIAEKIEKIQGEKLDWELSSLGISQLAWNKIIHQGIKPILVFAHPYTLKKILGSVGYYRMLAMVSQKSMNQVGLSTTRYEKKVPIEENTAISIAQHLNKMISCLIEADSSINPREFDLWRGMAAGSQAQGSWQNTKGNKIELLIQRLLQNHLKQNNLIKHSALFELQLVDERKIIFADDPDIAIYTNQQIIAAIEVKGGIDNAGVLERIGASLKSLSRVKEINSEAVTILLLQEVSVSKQAKQELEVHQSSINHWFTIEEILKQDNKKQNFFRLIDI